MTKNTSTRRTEASVEKDDRQDRDGPQAVDVGTALWHVSW